MILQKKTINNVPTLVPLTADTGSGVPVGTIIGQYKKVNMAGYLYLDGSTFDQTLYPALYAYLGTNVLPDYREFVLVGAEQNTTSATIAIHDVFTQGQEKAVFWYIKATTGIIESEATEMLNVFNNRMFPDYAHPITIPSGTTTWTATEDCYVAHYYFTGGGTGVALQRRLTIDGNIVGVADSSAEIMSMAMFSGYVKKGQVVSSAGNLLDLGSSQGVKFFPLTD